MAFALNARSADEGRSFFTKQGGGNKIGLKVVDERVTLVSDPLDPDAAALPFTPEGLPAKKTTWIENGVVRNLAYDRYWAQKQGKTADTVDRIAEARRAATTSMEELIASTQRGILVTRFWYIRPVDPRTVLYTGLTRDGTFLIEDGKITKAVKNLRYNESPVFMLNNLDAMGPSVRVSASEDGSPGFAIVVPPDQGARLQLHQPERRRLMTDRRDFLKKSAQVAAAVAAANAWKATGGVASAFASVSSPPLEEIPDSTHQGARSMTGLTAAKAAGAGYADVRIGRQRQNFVFTREQQIQNVVDTDSMGCGVRALVDGTWGFAATRVLTKDGVAAAAKEAVVDRQGESRRARQARGAHAAPSPSVGTWKSAYTKRSVGRVRRGEGRAAPQGERRGAEGEGRQVHLQRPVLREGRAQLREQRRLAHRSRPPFARGRSCRSPRSTPTRATSRIARTSRRRWDAAGSTCSSAISPGHAQQWGEEAAQKLTAKPVEVGRYDLVLHPSHLWLTIHESIAHPTELDRAMGYEANYAGTSFVSPPEKMLGQFKYGPEFMNIQGDRNQEGCLGTVGWDDEGVKPEPFLIIKKGIVNDYQTTREQARVARLVVQEAGPRDALARLLVRAELGQRPVPAHAERVAAAGREGAVVRGSHRRDRSRHRDHRRRLASRSTSSATTRSSADRSSTRSRAARSSAS